MRPEYSKMRYGFDPKTERRLQKNYWPASMKLSRMLNSRGLRKSHVVRLKHARVLLEKKIGALRSLTCNEKC